MRHPNKRHLERVLASLPKHKPISVYKTRHGDWRVERNIWIGGMFGHPLSYDFPTYEEALELVRELTAGEVA